jgi:protein arginine kinase activator
VDVTLITKICPNCGYEFAEFLETGFLGCSKCYEAFGNELEPYIEEIAESE